MSNRYSGGPRFASRTTGVAGGDLGRGAAIQIVLAASMATAALSEALLSLALSPARLARAAGWRNWPAAVAIIAVLLGPAAGAAFGSSWRTTLFTTLALACAATSIVAYRLLPRGARRTQAHAIAADPGELSSSDLARPRQFVPM